MIPEPATSGDTNRFRLVFNRISCAVPISNTKPSVARVAGVGYTIKEATAQATCLRHGEQSRGAKAVAGRLLLLLLTLSRVANVVSSRI